ncbi:MAG: thiol-disulfide oxidoreductase DCC family protein [Alphaproteobacteria bacterium]|nr:thiol-disulfide oxidoreductase DCC family protein [Alphaproteobacteria bacterium]
MRSAEPYSYRRDPTVPAFADDQAIVIFDGMCVMCSRFAQIILRRDRDGAFRLLAAQSELGSALYRHYGLDPVQYETNILIEDGRAWFKSEASIRILARLGFPWSLAVVGRVLPLSLRDRLYEIVARNRLRWFGVRSQCFVPRAEDADRFL